MNAMGFSAKPQSKADQNSPFFLFFFLSFERKVPFLVLRKKKRGHTKSSIKLICCINGMSNTYNCFTTFHFISNISNLIH